MIKTHLQAMIANGYKCLPIKPNTKRPDVAGWSNIELTSELYASWLERKPEYGVGLRLGDGLYCIDIDVKDSACVDSLVVDLDFNLGLSGFQRIGFAPKTAVFFRCDEDISKHKVFLRDAMGGEHAVELLGDGQQVVAYGIHPDTGSAYRWVDGEPLTHAIDDIPKLTKSDVLGWLESIAGVLPAGWVVVDKSSVGNTISDDDDYSHLLETKLDLTPDDVREDLLLVAANGMHYDDWFRVICAIWHQTDGSDEGYAIAREWSLRDSARFDDEALRIKWIEAAKRPSGRKVTFATVRALANKVRQSQAATTSVAKSQEWADKIRECSDATELRTVISSGIASDASLDSLERSALVTLWGDRYKALTGVRPPIKEIRAALSPKSLKTVASEKTSMLPKPDWLDGFVYVTGRDKFYNYHTGMWLTLQGINATYSRFCPNEDGVIEPTAASYHALHVHKIDSVDRPLYIPWAESLFTVDGVNCVNTFRKSSVPLATEIDPQGLDAIDIVKRHLGFVFNGRGDQIDLFIDWLAFQVQHIGRKVRFAPLIKGVEGDGKSVLSKLVKAVIGDSNVKIISAEAISSNFSGWATDAAVGVLEEVRIVGHNRYEIMNKMKPLITNDSISVHPKGFEEYNAPNTMNYMAFTNYSDALPLQETDRRWWPIFTPWNSREEMQSIVGESLDVYFDRLHDAIEMCGGALRAWLLNHVISDAFKPNGSAPRTKERESMIANGRDDIEEIVESVIADGGYGLHVDAVSVKHLNDALLMMDGAPDLTGRMVATALRKLGYSRIGGKSGVMKADGVPLRVWVKRHDMSSKDVLALWADSLATDKEIPF